jgi:hypothetical protein
MDARREQEAKNSTDTSCRVRTLTGKEIELDIENDYKVLFRPMPFFYRHYMAVLAPWFGLHPVNTVPKVSQIKEKVEEKEGIPPAQQRLIYGGKQMYVRSYGSWDRRRCKQHADNVMT